jgi:hydrogenase maturation protease
MVQNEFLIVGVGNALRQDDGAGLALAEALRSALTERGRATQIRQVQQLLPELAEEIGEIQPRILVIADCRQAAEGKNEAEVSRLDRPQEPGASATGGAGLDSHHLTAQQLVAMAERLYGYAGGAWLATVPGEAFGHGQNMSLLTTEAIPRAVQTLLERF